MSSDSMNSYDSSVSNNSLDTTTPANHNNSNGYQVSEYFPCAHSKVIRHKNRSNCFTCGIFLHDTAKSYKSPKMKYGAYFDPSRFYSSTIKTRQPKIVISSDSEFYKHRNQLLDLVQETSDKLRLSSNTIHLACMFLDLVLSRLPNIPVGQYQAYAATCVMLAAKSIELDERIPFISKLQRYSGLTSYKPKDFSAAEHVILRELSWNLQCPTNIDVLEYYLSQGIIFSTDLLLNDELSNTIEENAFKDKSNFNNMAKDFTTAFNQLSIGEKENQSSTTTQSQQNKKKTVLLGELSDMRIFAIVSKIEKDYLRLANLISRDHRFYDIDTKTLSGACVCFLRKMNGISPIWCSQLSVLSNNLINSEYQLSETLNLLESRFRQYFQPQNIQLAAKRPSILSPNNSSTLLRDSENQNKPPTAAITPSKYVFKNNNNIPNVNSYKNANSEYASYKTGGSYNNTHSQTSSCSKPLPFNQQSNEIPTLSHFTAVSHHTNGVLGNKTNYSQYTSNFQNASTAHSSQQQNLPSQGSYVRSNSQFQANPYVGLARIGSNIL